jgi:hypothetical protein
MMKSIVYLFIGTELYTRTLHCSLTAKADRRSMRCSASVVLHPSGEATCHSSARCLALGVVGKACRGSTSR